MANPEFFKLQGAERYKATKTHVSTIPWALIEPHRKQAYANHSQTLERLNERGGLGVEELWCVMHDKPLSGPDKVTFNDACDWLDNLLNVGKIRPCTTTTGQRVVLEFKDVPLSLIEDLEDVVNPEGQKAHWYYRNKYYVYIDVCELIVQAIFNDPWTVSVYDFMATHIDNRWKAASCIKLKIPEVEAA